MLGIVILENILDVCSLYYKMFLLLQCTLAHSHVPSVIVSWQFCILGFDQHSDCPHFSSAGGGACWSSWWTYWLAQQLQTVGWSSNHWRFWKKKKKTAPWHSLHHNLSSHDWLSLISVWFSPHSPYGLTCVYHNCSCTVETCMRFEYLHNQGRSMKGCF